jgi:hypothetical protein
MNLGLINLRKDEICFEEFVHVCFLAGMKSSLFHMNIQARYN